MSGGGFLTPAKRYLDDELADEVMDVEYGPPPPPVINSRQMAELGYKGISAQPTLVKPPKSLRMTRGDRLIRYGPSLEAAYMMEPVGKSAQYQNRIADAFYGKGKYKRKRATGRGRYTFGSFIRDVESVGRRAEGTANRFLSKGLPKVLAARKMLGRGIYSGRGMYNQNVLIEGGDAPMSVGMGASDNQEVIINHCEYLQDVYGPSDAKFTNNQLDINPGLLENFPFLAQIAANYEEYEFIQLMFHFKSTVDASISSTGTTGTLVMATNYNADAPGFLSKESMMQYHGANNTRLDQDMDHGVECDPTKNAGTTIRYVRTLPVVDGQQKKEFDLGKFQWAIVNIPSQFNNQQVGELWCSYTVKLGKPKLATALGRTIAEDRFISNGGESTTSILGTSLLKLSQSNIGVKLTELDTGGNNVKLFFTFPDFLTGRFELKHESLGDAVGYTDIAVRGNVTLVEDIWDGAQYVSSIQGRSTNATTASNIRIHVDVRPAVSGVDNQLEVILTSVDAFPHSIDIKPYNPDLQLIWQNVSTGAVVVPS